MPAQHRQGRQLSLIAAGVAVLLGGCGSGDRDHQDESGPAADGTRIELIYVDGDTAQAPADSPEEAVAEPSAAAGAGAPEHVAIPAAPTAEDEVGGDDLIAYDAAGDFTVQVGTFADAGRARRRARELVDLGYPAYTIAHPQGGQVRVRIGYFATRDAADRFGQRFRRDHGDGYWIDRRSVEGAGR